MFIDTSVIMYAGGAEHPHRASCQRVLERVADRSLEAVTSTEVVQEILHRFARGQRETGQRMARSVLNLFDDLLPVDRQSVGEAVSLFARHLGCPRATRSISAPASDTTSATSCR